MGLVAWEGIFHILTVTLHKVCKHQCFQTIKHQVLLLAETSDT
jgi:hypothetical protein